MDQVLAPRGGATAAHCGPLQKPVEGSELGGGVERFLCGGDRGSSEFGHCFPRIFPSSEQMPKVLAPLHPTCMAICAPPFQFFGRWSLCSSTCV